MRAIVRFFDQLEDKIRGKLSHYPVLYAFIAGVAIVLFWRGVWHTADDLGIGSGTSLIMSIVIMLSSGIFVSFFIGDNIIMGGLRREKKLIEKTEKELRSEIISINDLNRELKAVRKELREIKKHLR